MWWRVFLQFCGWNSRGHLWTVAGSEYRHRSSSAGQLSRLYNYRRETTRNAARPAQGRRNPAGPGRILGLSGRVSLCGSDRVLGQTIPPPYTCQFLLRGIAYGTVPCLLSKFSVYMLIRVSSFLSDTLMDCIMN